MSSTTLKEPHQRELFGHPIGLYILFFTEMWERFSYYGMRAILVLYIASSIEDGGLGWTKSNALVLYGWYTMLVYIMAIPGGIIADKLIGQRKSVLIGGLILIAGHGILAVEYQWAFYTGLILIILGVGMLKPNISTMVGGLYKKGDIRRDKGFTIFYIGINVGAFLASLIVGYVGEKIGWHYGFGLAGIGMALGMITYYFGQKYLSHVGNSINKSANKDQKELMKKPLTSIEKDRIKVLLISFLIIIVFWGAFEQAGGLLNIYAKEKINRVILGWTMPASWFQSFNSLFIILFGTTVASFWAIRKLKGKETSTLFKMGIGTIIMGLGFLLMAFASKSASSIAYGTASFWWLVGAYFLHTIGELCASPTALSFITKLAPLKYASIMMGVYFAATGLGNKLAGSIGEASQEEPIKIELISNKSETTALLGKKDSLLLHDKDFVIRTKSYLIDNNDINIIDLDSDKSVLPLIKVKNPDKLDEIKTIFKDNKVTKINPYHITLRFTKDFEAKKIKTNMGDGKNYSGKLIIEEVQSKREFKTFLGIFILTLVFGLLIILLLKPLKRLTHGAEDNEHKMTDDDNEGFELADNN